MNLRLKSAKIRCGIEFRLTKKMVKSKWMHLKILKSRIWNLTKLSMRLRFEIENGESLKMKFPGQRNLQWRH